MCCLEIAKTVGWLGESLGFWLQTGAFFISALGAIGVIYFNGKQARVRALIDILLHQKSDTALIEATRKVLLLKSNGGTLSSHAVSDTEERRTILRVLNNQEFLAVGIRLRAFDETVYKEMQCTNVLRLWSSSKGFIHELREDDKKKTLFQDFERLATRWEKDPIKSVK
jgi:hypothetical protein